jgi:hypothetical protein
MWISTVAPSHLKRDESGLYGPPQRSVGGGEPRGALALVADDIDDDLRGRRGDARHRDLVATGAGLVDDR